MNSELDTSRTLPPADVAEKSSGDLLDDLYEEKVRSKAQEHLGDAVKTLVHLAKKSKSDSVRRLAANDIIEHGHKRKWVDPAANVPGAGGGTITVNLITFEASAHGREVAASQAIEIAARVAATAPEILDITPEEEDSNPDPLLEICLRNPGAG